MSKYVIPFNNKYIICIFSFSLSPYFSLFCFIGLKQHKNEQILEREVKEERDR